MDVMLQADKQFSVILYIQQMQTRSKLFSKFEGECHKGVPVKCHFNSWESKRGNILKEINVQFPISSNLKMSNFKVVQSKINL